MLSLPATVNNGCQCWQDADLQSLGVQPLLLLELLPETWPAAKEAK
jgi:hypothetical protein